MRQWDTSVKFCVMIAVVNLLRNQHSTILLTMYTFKPLSLVAHSILRTFTEPSENQKNYVRTLSKCLVPQGFPISNFSLWFCILCSMVWKKQITDFETLKCWAKVLKCYVVKQVVVFFFVLPYFIIHFYGIEFISSSVINTKVVNINTYIYKYSGINIHFKKRRLITSCASAWLCKNN